MNLQEIKDFIERPKLTMLNEELNVPEKFNFLKPFFEKVKVIGKQSKHKQEYYKHVLLSDDAKKEEGSHFTPQFITNIVNEYIKQSDFKFNSIIDYTGGIGAFVFAINDIKNKHIEIWDINKKSTDISKAIAKQLNLIIHTKVIDTLNYARQNTENTFFSEPIDTFDLLVLNPPFNLDLKSNTDFVKLALKMMHQNSKAFIVLPNGFLSNSNSYNQEFRKHLIENKLIEAIFSFEGKIFENTGIPTTMLVLSNDKNEQIKIYNFEDLDLPKIKIQTKTNPLTKRVYYRNVKDYSAFKFDIKKYEIPQNEEWLIDFSLIPRRMLFDAEEEKKKLKKNEKRTKHNLTILDKYQIRVKNQNLEKRVNQMIGLLKAASCILLTDRGKNEAIINYELKKIEVDVLIVEILKVLTDKNLLYKDKNKMRKLYEKEEKNINTTLKIIREALLDLLF